MLEVDAATSAATRSSNASYTRIGCCKGDGCAIPLTTAAARGGRQAELVFRIVQEALTNIARHAEAERVTLNLLRAARNLMLQIRDDGRGITSSDREKDLSVADWHPGARREIRWGDIH